MSETTECRVMPWDEYERRVRAAVETLLGGRGRRAPEAETELKSLLGYTNKDAVLALLEPPFICQECGEFFRTALKYPPYTEACCFSCREQRKERDLEARIRAEVEARAAP